MRLAELHLGRPAWWRDAVRLFGCARALFSAGDAELTNLGLTLEGICLLRDSRPWAALEKRRADCRRAQIEIGAFTSEAYPELLREIPDPPPILYYRGRVPADLRPAVGVVGSRRPTRYGRHTAHAVSRALAAAGVAVISGMAYGIDACAHAGALDAGLSAAVLACGLDRPYPRGNHHLFEMLVRQGTVLSEQPPGTDARAYLFPARNRIVTGLSSAVVVVEAAKRSGSLVSARLALEQGREVFAVPGNIDSPTSVGTNALLRDGCAPFIDVADVLHALGLESVCDERGEAVRPHVDDPDAAAVLAVLEARPSHVDRVVESCRLDGARVLELLTALELAGLVERTAGGFALSRGRRDGGRPGGATSSGA